MYGLELNLIACTLFAGLRSLHMPLLVATLNSVTVRQASGDGLGAGVMSREAGRKQELKRRSSLRGCAGDGARPIISAIMIECI